MNKVIYVTYDINLRNYMTKLGIRYLILGKSPNPPYKTFYIYDRTTDEFNNALESWFAKK